MAINKNRNNNRLFYNFLISYIFILIIPILLGSFAYVKVQKLVKEDSINSSLSILEQTKDIMDNRLEELSKMCNQLTLNTKFRRILSIGKSIHYEEYYNFYQFVNDLRPYTITDNFIDSFLVYFRKSGLIFTPSTFYRESFFYDDFFKYGEMSRDEWFDLMLENYQRGKFYPRKNVVLETRSFPSITFIRSFPLNNEEYYNATIIVFIKEHEIQKLLSKINLYNEGWVYISDNDGNIITSISPGRNEIPSHDIGANKNKGFKEIDISGRQMITIYTTSDKNGWTYVATIPSDILLQRVSNIRNSIFILVTVSIIAGLIVASYLSYKRSRPILDIIRLIRDFLGGQSDNKKSEYDYLRGSVQNIIVKNKNLEEISKMQLPLLQAAFFERLLKDKYTNIEEINSIVKHIRLDVSGDYFLVIMMNMLNYEAPYIENDTIYKLDILRAEIASILMDNAKIRHYLHYEDENKIALLLFYDETDYNQCVEKATNIIEIISTKIYEKYKQRIIFACGEITDNLLNIGSCYDEAMRALEYKLMSKDNSILWYNQIPVKGTNYVYTTDMETKLINLAVTGGIEEIIKILNTIYGQNLLERKLSVDMMKQLVYDMRGTIYKIMDKIQINNVVDEELELLQSKDNMEEILNSFIEIYEKICDIVNKQKKSNNMELFESIVKYIKENYTRSELNVSIISSNFNISEAYLSNFFKEHAGVTLASYLENLRIEEACKLLSETDFSVTTVSAKVGYNSDKSFRRAFKRVMGVNPTTYSKNTLVKDQ